MIDLSTLRAPWLMAEESLRLIAEALPRARPGAASTEPQREAAARQLRAVSGKVAVLPVYGVIEPRWSLLGELFGSAPLNLLSAALDRLGRDKQCSAIVLDIDSPGGTSYGVREFADQVATVNAVKPVYAVANSLCASAAYWIGSQAGHLSVTPGGDVGSIGVFMMHVDYSKALESEGIKVSVVKAGKNKAELNPAEPLSEGARSHLQDLVDETYGDFCAAVAKGRRCSVADVRSASWGQGRIVPAKAALAAGMVDRIATLGEVLDRLGGTAPTWSRDAASVEVLRLRHAHQKAREAAWEASGSTRASDSWMEV